MNKLYILATVILCAITGLFVYQYKPTSIKLPFVYTNKPLSESQYSCDSLIDTRIMSGNNSLINGIVGELSKGTDKLAINIDGDKLYFLTKASVEAGVAKSEPWPVLKNTTSKLVAVLNTLDDPSSDINLFILNKKNGMAVWVKTKTEKFGTENPSSESMYLTCR